MLSIKNVLMALAVFLMPGGLFVALFMAWKKRKAMSNVISFEKKKRQFEKRKLKELK